MGFDSLAAVELKNRLTTLSGLSIPVTTVFDYPNSARLAEYLLEEARPASTERSTGGLPVEREFERLETALGDIESAEQRDLVVARMRVLLAEFSPDGEDDLADATDEEIFEVLDKELGRR